MSILDEFNNIHYTGGDCTSSNIKIYLNLRDNDCFDFSCYDDENPRLLYGIEEIFVDYIEAKTEDLNEVEIWELLDNNDFTDSEGIYMLIDHHDGNLSFISSHEQLVKASRLFALQDFLRDSIYEWKCEFKEELSISFNKFITLWKNRRDRKRKETLDKLPIHCLENLISSYL